MLIEQLAGTLVARFLAFAFGSGAAEPGTVGGSFLLCLLPVDALLELLEVDQIPHGRLRHASPAGGVAMQSIDERVRATLELTASKCGGYAQASSIFIYEIPHYAV